MADGTRKRVDQLSVGEEIMTYDHFNGRAGSAPVAYIFMSHGMCDQIRLTFADGTEIKVLKEHGFFDREENKYVQINKNNAADYVGHSFYNLESGSFVELISYECSVEETDAYSVLSAYDINHAANGFLAVSDEIEGLYNYFEFDENMKYDEEKMQQDIATYGLATYDMFASYCTEEEFEVFNCRYLSIAVGKGLTTYESLAERMVRFSGNSQ